MAGTCYSVKHFAYGQTGERRGCKQHVGGADNKESVWQPQKADDAMAGANLVEDSLTATPLSSRLLVLVTGTFSQ